MNVYTLSQWLLFFFLYSFFGWIWESCYVSLREHRWVNRGFMAMDMKKMLAQLDETKVQIRKLQERIREASEEMSEKLRTAAEGVPEKLRSAAATAGEMPGRLRTAAGDRSEKLRTAAGNRSEKFRTAAGDVPEKLRLELAELKENAAKELQKILSRSDETHAGAMKQLRRNPTAASSRFKDVLEELKKYTEKDK